MGKTLVNPMPGTRWLSVCVLLFLASGSFGCSLRKVALRGVADGLSDGTGGAFARDDDPDLVGGALPFALKTMESLADALDDHEGLRLALASGFTQYAYAWVQWDAELLATQDPLRAQALRARAAKLFVRARDYGIAGLRLKRGITLEELRSTEDLRAGALRKLQKDDVPMLYWTLVPWAAALSANKRNLELVGDLPAIASLLDRALALDESWNLGALHEFSLAFDSARAGGTTKEAQEQHYKRALELSRGQRLSVQVSWAEQMLVPAQDKQAFLSLLQKVVAFDLDQEALRGSRLANTIAQRRARFLIAHVEDFILSDDEPASR